MVFPKTSCFDHDIVVHLSIKQTPVMILWFFIFYLYIWFHKYNCKTVLYTNFIDGCKIATTTTFIFSINLRVCLTVASYLNAWLCIR